jgi:2,4-dienoyl-CoA reductase-like NADH-dependent reductase (Old Yellow Enzyme family)
MAFEAVLSRLNLGPIKLRNRVVMAPMTREQSPKGVPTKRVADYYARRAAGGAGLIITEGAAPSEAGCFGTDVPRAFGDAALSGWQGVVKAVHAESSAIFMQIWHVGAFSPALINMSDSLGNTVERISPSGLAAPEMPFGRAMTQSDIERTIEEFANAASNAQRCGFDGIEIHAAHGYLPDQFLWTGTNTRDDVYGKDSVGRLRYLTELIKACRRLVGPDFPISLRFSQWKQLDYDARLVDSPAELELLLHPLVDAGVSIFHVSTRRFDAPAFKNERRSLASWTRGISGCPVIAVGSVTLGNDFKSEMGKVLANPVADDVARVEEALVNDDFDLIALGRALIANPNWVEIIQSGRLENLKPFSRAMLEELV